MTRYVCLSMGGLFLSLGLVTSGCIVDECGDDLEDSCWAGDCEECGGNNDRRDEGVWDSGAEDEVTSEDAQSGEPKDTAESKDTDQADEDEGSRDHEGEGEEETQGGETRVEDRSSGCDTDITDTADTDEPSEAVEDGVRSEYDCATEDKNGCQTDVCDAISTLDIPSVYMCSSPCGDCEYVIHECEENLSACLQGVCIDPDQADFGLLLDCSILYRECVAAQES